jgi:site-specific DNA recombinase
MKKAIGYCRVSTDDQSNSAEAQEKRIRSWASLHGVELLDVIVDIGEFSGNLDRPGAIRVLDLVNRKQVSAVVITKIDRMSRSVRDILDLVDTFNAKEVAFVSIDESIDTKSPLGQFFITIVTAFAELERKLIGSRTKAGLDHIKSQGFPAGRAPFGWTAQPRTDEERRLKIRKPMLENKTEQAIIKIVMSMRNRGESWKNIAAELNARGYRTRVRRTKKGGVEGGKEWTIQGVFDIYTAVTEKVA